jgi:endonuclease/exonuclease/phosphatase family metal-dependent hydrolase
MDCGSPWSKDGTRREETRSPRRCAGWFACRSDMMTGLLTWLALLAPCDLSILSYNVLYRGGRPAATLKLIQTVDADVVVLQEVTPKWKSRLERRLRKQYPHRHYRDSGGAYGYATLSKHPLRGSQLLRVRGAPPFALCHEVQLGATTVALCNAHLKSGGSAMRKAEGMFRRLSKNLALRTRQWAALVQWLDDRPTPLQLVAGDMNTPGFDPLNTRIAARFQDAMVKAGVADATYPASAFPKYTLVKNLPPRPLVRLDYIWASPDWTVQSGAIRRDGGSDHLPVFARLQRPGCALKTGVPDGG